MARSFSAKTSSNEWQRIVPRESAGPARGVCWHTMKRTTVKLPDQLDARLRHEAKCRGMTVSEVTREAIAIHVGGQGTRKLGGGKVWHSGRSDVSERIEEILSAEPAP